MGDRIHAAALRMLARRALSTVEIEERLVRKGFGREETRLETERLRAAGLLDDADIAVAVCRDLMRSGFGRRRIVAALRRRGLDAGTVDDAVRGIDQESAAAALRVALEKARRRHGGDLELPAVKAKVIRYLLGRGFLPAEIHGILKIELGEDDYAGEAFQ